MLRVVAVAAAVAVLGANAQEPGMYSREGNLNIEVGNGKKILLKQGAQEEVDLLAELANLESQLATYETGFNDAVNLAINRREVSTTIDIDINQEAAAKSWLNLGKFDVSQVVHVMLSAKGCGLGYGMSIDVVGAWGLMKENNPSTPEAFFLGAGDTANGGNFDMYFKPVDETKYYLYLKYNAEATSWCSNQAKDRGDPSYQFQFSAGVTLSTPFVEDADASAPTFNTVGQFMSQTSLCNKLSLEDLQAKIDAFNINVITAKYQSNIDDPTPRTVEPDDEMGRAAGRYSEGDGVIFLGLFDGAQTVHVDFEDKGCKRSVGMSYTIVARRGLDQENNPAVPEAFFFGSGNAWASQNIDFKYKKHTVGSKANNQYWLWLHLPQQPGGSNGCGQQPDAAFSVHSVSVKVTTSSKQLDTDQDTLEKVGGYKDTDSSILTMPQRSLKEIADRVDNLNSVSTVEWDANKGEDTGIKANSPDPIPLGLFKVAQVVEVVAELAGCQQTFGIHTNVVARSGIYTADLDNTGWLGAPTSFMFGSAANSATANVDKVHLYWQPINGGEYWMWMKIDGPEQQCRVSADEPDKMNEMMPHVATIAVKLSSAQKVPAEGTVQPAFVACRKNDDGSYDKADQTCAKQLDRVSIQDVADMTTPGSPKMNAVVQAALNQRTFLPFKYNSNFAAGSETKGEALMYIGTFNAWEVIHLDVSDNGCQSTTGIFFNIVARWGLDGAKCQDTLDPNSDYCAPEAFMFGTAHNTAAGNIKPYWVAIDGKQTLYELYIGVTNFNQCGDDESRPHTLLASVRSSGPLKGDYDTATGVWNNKGQGAGVGAGCDSYAGKDAPITNCGNSRSKLSAIAVMSIEDAATAVAKTAPNEQMLMDKFDSKAITGMTVKMTDYGTQNKKVLNIRYVANDAETADKDNEWAIQVPLGLMKTFQPLHITVQDIGAGSGIGHSYTCVAKQQAGSSAGQAKWFPECFYFGSAAADNDDRNNNFNFYFMSKDNSKFPGSRAAAQDYILYLGISEFNKARTGKAAHTLAVEITSASTIRWCLPGDDAWKSNGNGCDDFNLEDAKNFWAKTTSNQILTDTTIFPTEEMVKKNPDVGTTGGKGGLVKPFLSLEDVNAKVEKVAKNARRCFAAKKSMNPDTGKCCDPTDITRCN
jgi:hypothetical protein